MNPYDVLIVIVGAVLLLFGVIKGILKILIGIGTLIAAFLLASWFDGVVGSLFSGFIESDGWRRLLGFAVIFLGTIILGGILGRVFAKVMEAANVRWVDRLAGAGLGLVATVLLFGALTVPLAAYLPEGNSFLGRSHLAPYTVNFSRAISAAVPASVRVRFHEGIRKLEKTWQGRGEVIETGDGAALRP